MGEKSRRRLVESMEQISVQRAKRKKTIVMYVYNNIIIIMNRECKCNDTSCYTSDVVFL